MSLAIGKGVASVAPKFKAALKKLAHQGSDALRPQLIVSQDATSSHWKPPLISNRVANVLRKQAINEGTYGSFDTEALRGWDAQWDVDLASSRSKGTGRIKIRPPNKTSRQRTRETRAKKLEATMQDMDGRIETYYQGKQNAKPAKSFENFHKQLMQVKS